MSAAPVSVQQQAVVVSVTELDCEAAFDSAPACTEDVSITVGSACCGEVDGEVQVTSPCQVGTAQPRVCDKEHIVMLIFFFVVLAYWQLLNVVFPKIIV